MKNKNVLLILLVVLLLMSNFFFGYMLLKPKYAPDFRRDFNRGDFQQMQLTDEQIQSVTSFFDSTTDTTKINNYCEQNRMECFYYCRNINTNNQYCSQLMQGRPN